MAFVYHMLANVLVCRSGSVDLPAYTYTGSNGRVEMQGWKGWEWAGMPALDVVVRMCFSGLDPGFFFCHEGSFRCIMYLRAGDTSRSIGFVLFFCFVFVIAIGYLARKK